MPTEEPPSPPTPSRVERWLLRPLLHGLAWFFHTRSPRAVRTWAAVLHFLAWPLLIGKRRIVRANLAVAFPELGRAERDRLAARNLRYLFELALDWLNFFVHPEDIPHRLMRPAETATTLASQRAPSPGLPGIIFCTPHLGNWELESRVSYLSGHPGAVIVARFRSELLNRLAFGFRTAGDDTLVIPADGAARGSIRALRSGRDLGILIDQNISPRHGGVFLPFFGLPAPSSRLPASLALHLRVPIVVCACIKQPDGTFRMEVEPLGRPAAEYADDLALTAAILGAFERLIRRHPEQYLWLYPRWKYLPSNTPPESRGRFPFYAIPKRYPCPPEYLP